MTVFDPHSVLDALEVEYAARAAAIRRDLAASHSQDFAEQASERQNDEVLEALLHEAEAAQQGVARAKLRVAAGTYGACVRCGEPIATARLHAFPAAECCLGCADQDR